MFSTSQVGSWLLIVGFLAIGVLNMAATSEPTYRAYAGGDCDPEDAICCADGEACCVNGLWTCDCPSQ